MCPVCGGRQSQSCVDTREMSFHPKRQNAISAMRVTWAAPTSVMVYHGQKAGRVTAGLKQAASVGSVL